MARREPTKSRAASRRPSRMRLLVVCGTKKTEEQYIRGLRAHIGNPAVDLTVVNRPKDPTAVVAYASKFLLASQRDFDEVWCVFDVDEFDIGPARALAAAEGFEIAVSNPCFEFWLLLHHEDHRGHLRVCDDAGTRLRRHVPAYDKTALIFTDFAEGVDPACRRAKAIDGRSESVHANPSSGMWRLVWAMLGGET